MSHGLPADFGPKFAAQNALTNSLSVNAFKKICTLGIADLIPPTLRTRSTLAAARIKATVPMAVSVMEHQALKLREGDGIEIIPDPVYDVKHFVHMVARPRS